MGTLGSQEAGSREIFLSKGLASEESKKRWACSCVLGWHFSWQVRLTNEIGVSNSKTNLCLFSGSQVWELEWNKSASRALKQCCYYVQPACNPVIIFLSLLHCCISSMCMTTTFCSVSLSKCGFVLRF